MFPFHPKRSLLGVLVSVESDNICDQINPFVHSVKLKKKKKLKMQLQF